MDKEPSSSTDEEMVPIINFNILSGILNGETKEKLCSEYGY